MQKKNQNCFICNQKLTLTEELIRLQNYCYFCHMTFSPFSTELVQKVSPVQLTELFATL